MVDCNRPDTLFIDRENQTALLIGLAVCLSHKLSNTEAEKIMKYENLALEIKNIWKLNSVFIYPLIMLAEGVATKNFLTYLENTDLTRNI
jgi:hypothetical protein